MSRPADVYDSLRPLQDKHSSFAVLGTDPAPYTMADSIVDARRAAFESFNALTHISLSFFNGVWQIGESCSPGVPLTIPPTWRRGRAERVFDAIFRWCRVMGLPGDVYDKIIATLKDRAARCDAAKAADVMAAKRDAVQLKAAWREWREYGGRRPVEYGGPDEPDPLAETFDDHRRFDSVPSRPAFVPRPQPFGIDQPPPEQDMRAVTDRLFAEWRAEIDAAAKAAAKFDTGRRKTKGPLRFAPGYNVDPAPVPAVFWRLPATPARPSVFVPLFYEPPDR